MPSDGGSGGNRALVDQKMSMVRNMARRLASRLPATVHVEDLVQAGVVGLLESLRDEDAGLSSNFDAYARIRIHGAMIDEVRRNDWSSRSANRIRREISRAVESVEKRVGRPANSREVAEEIGTDLATYYDLLRRAAESRVYSVSDVPGTDGADSQAFDDERNNPAREYECDSLRRALGCAIGKLSLRERQIVSLYFANERSLREIAETVGVSESRISQIRTRATARLRKLIGDWESGYGE